MSYPYPQDRHRDRKEKGEQPYKDAKESMAQADVELENEVSAQNAPDSGPTSTDDVSDEMIDRLRRVNEKIEARHGEEPGSTERSH
jgi:hypothetical protein